MALNAQKLGGIAVALLLSSPLSAFALIVKTTDPSVAAAFSAGLSLETFDDLTAFTITSYASGQTINDAAKFSSRNSLTQPTFHSGGASFNDPVGNPGHPIGIFDPDGAIAADFVSANNVAGPLVINENEPFNFGFMEVIFPDEVSHVGFWVTHGTVTLSLRDNTGTDFTSGDFTVIGVKGEFIGISRDLAEVKVAALIPGTEAFTIDSFVFGIPEPSTALLAAVGSIGLLLRRRRRNRA